MDKKRSVLIKQLKEFKNNNKLEKMYFFGSRAVGKPHRWSDVDLVIVSKNFRGKGLLERSPPLHINWDLNYPVDFLCYTPEEFKKLQKRVSIVSEAVKNGIEV